MLVIQGLGLGEIGVSDNDNGDTEQSSIVVFGFTLQHNNILSKYIKVVVIETFYYKQTKSFVFRQKDNLGSIFVP